MEIKNISCAINTYSVEEVNSNLLKVSIRVMHEGVNLKDTSFSFEAMEKAKNSCKNIPILAYIKRDKNGEAIDFDQHNIIMKIVETDDGLELKEYYEEQPIGVIPETNNYRYELINGVNHVVVDGYIWKNYSNEAYELLMNTKSKSVSMEIAVNEGKMDEYGVYNINNYNYLGVTVLGDDITPGMGFTCNITKYSNNVDFNRVIKDIRNEIDTYLEKGVKSMDENIVVETVEIEATELEEIEAVKKEATELEVEEIIEEAKIEEITEEANIEETVEDNTLQEPVMEEIVEENTLETIESVCEVQFDQSIEEDVQRTPECQPTPQNDIQEKIENFAKVVVGEIDFSSDGFDIDVVLAKSIEKFELMSEELDSLRLFKQKIDEETFKAEVYSVFSDFDFKEEEITELKTKALNKELSIKDLTKELYALEGIKAMQSKKKYSTKEVEVARISIHDIDGKTYKPYGGLLD